MRTSLSLVIAISFLAAAVSALGRNRDKAVKSTHPTSPAVDFSTLRAEDIERICQQQVVGNVGPFFHGWVVKALQRNPFNRPQLITEDIQGSVEDHLEKLNNYVKDLTQVSKDVAKYSRFNFDVKVNDLVARVNDLIKVPHINPFDTKEKLAEVAENLGPHAHQVVEDYAEDDVDRTTIETIGHTFKAEDLDKKAPVDELLKGIIEKHKAIIIPSLYKIIEIFTNNDEGKLYPNLDTAQKDWLQSYFDAFKYLLPEKDHHEAVIKGLTHQTATLSKPAHTYVNKDHFKYLVSIDSAYKPYFFRDDFITLFNPNYSLEDLHDAAISALFSWKFFDSFDNVKYSDATRPSEDSQESLKDRMIARLHNMLYKVYTMARDDGTLPPSHADDNKAILKKLYTWVKDTKLFSNPKIDEEGTLQDAGKKNHGLFPAPKFQKYFLPLLDLICKKIGEDCDILKDKEDIVNKFVEYNIYPIAKNDKTFQEVLTPGLFDTIGHAGAIKELTTFTENLDEFAPLDDEEEEEEDKKEEEKIVKTPTNFLEHEAHPEDFVPTFDMIDTKEAKKPATTEMPAFIRRNLKKPAISTADIKDIPELIKQPSTKKDEPISPKLKPTLPKEKEPTPQEKAEAVQKKFNTEIGEKFLPDAKAKDDKGVVHLDSFIDTIAAIGNPLKKRKIKNLLAKFLITTNSKPLVEKFNEKALAEIRAPINYKNSAGFRNFLFRTMNLNDRYHPTTGDDEYNYSMDANVYIFMAGKDEKARLGSLSEIDARREEETTGLSVKKRVQLIDEELASLKGSFFADKSVQARRAAMFKGPLDSKFIERAEGVEFFGHFLDFFQYYEVITKLPEASNVDYYRIYLTFYQILAHFRRGQVQEFKNPHQYVLLKMQECMAIAEAQDSFVLANKLNGHCVFSYRKYAEVYYFYKMYLFAFNKNVDIDQSILKGEDFSVHTRMFLVFSSLNGAFSHILNNQCEDDALRPICQSWNMYNGILHYIRSESTAEVDFARQLSSVKVQNVAHRINLFNGVEAAYYHNRQANMIRWSRVARLFDNEGVDTSTGLGKLLKFEPNEEGALATYLSRTFKKLAITDKEFAISEFVQKVLNSKETGDYRTDDLLRYLHFSDRVAPFHIKLFLQFAVNDAQFLRLARVLIQNDITSNLVSINDANKDTFFLSLAAAVDKMDKSKISDYVYDALQEQYATTLRQCKAVAAKTVKDVLDDDFFNDILSGEISLEEDPVSVNEEIKIKHDLQTHYQAVELRIDIPKGENIRDLLKEQQKNLQTQYPDAKIDIGDYDISEEVVYFDEEGRPISPEDLENYDPEDIEDDSEEQEEEIMANPFLRRLSSTHADQLAKAIETKSENQSITPTKLQRSSSRVNSGLIDPNVVQGLQGLKKRLERTKKPRSSSRKRTSSRQKKFKRMQVDPKVVRAEHDGAKRQFQAQMKLQTKHKLVV
jgi:hypothetical protein